MITLNPGYLNSLGPMLLAHVEQALAEKKVPYSTEWNPEIVCKPSFLHLAPKVGPHLFDEWEEGQILKAIHKKVLKENGFFDKFKTIRFEGFGPNRLVKDRTAFFYLTSGSLQMRTCGEGYSEGKGKMISLVSPSKAFYENEPSLTIDINNLAVKPLRYISVSETVPTTYYFELTFDWVDEK